MQVSRTNGEKCFDLFNIYLMIFICFMMVYPFWYQICMSLSDPSRVLIEDTFFWPAGFSTASYKAVLTSFYMGSGFTNSLFVTVIGTLLGVFFTTLTAYSISKKTLPGKSVITFIIVFTMLFGGGMIPLYFVVRNTGLINSLWALIIPTMINPFNVVIMRNFFTNMPGEIEESAKIDGASDYLIFFRLIIPLSLPVIATVSLWVAVSHWNDFFHCLLYINDRKKYVLQMILREIINSTKGDTLLRMEGSTMDVMPDTIKAASIIVVTVPILLVFPFLQRYFVKGIIMGSLKG